MIYFTSDPHYGHANVIRYCARPFRDVQEMNEALINNWNSVVTQDDTVYVLGDFSLGFSEVERYSSRLLGKKFLIPGNHDKLHSWIIKVIIFKRRKYGLRNIKAKAGKYCQNN